MSHDPLAWIDLELAHLDAVHLRRPLQMRAGAQCPAELRWNDQRLLNFSANDYLGLANDSRLTSAVAHALAHEGFGAGASPLVTGRGSEHAALERELAEFEETEAALLFSSGYAANFGTVAALAGKEDLILSDEKNHASLIDGCRLSGATVRIFAHNSIDDVCRQFSGWENFRRRLLVTDSLFSMDGDLARLPELAEIAAAHRAMLLVDEAHATGVFGPQGRGVCEYFGLHEQVHVRVGTLSKALGGIGGFVAGRRSLIEFLANRARSYVFSTAAPGITCAAARAALQCVRDEPHRRTALLESAKHVRATLRAQGWRIPEGISQIVPLVVGDAQGALDLAARLRQQGILIPAIRPPSVPAGESLLRISLSYSHSVAALSHLCESMGPLFDARYASAPAGKMAPRSLRESSPHDRGAPSPGGAV